MFTNLLRYIIILTILGKCLSITNKSSKIEIDIVPRVVRGFPAKLGDVPYQVAFKALASRTTQSYLTFCGGTIVGPTKILSAAHCFVEDKSACAKIFFKRGRVQKKELRNKFAVAATLYNKGYKPESDDTPEGQWRKLKEVYYPAKYKFPKKDIAIVFTKTPFIYNKYVNEIPYASRYADYQGKCLVSGYGRITNVGKQKSNKLLLAHLEIVPYRHCNRHYKKNMHAFVCTSSMVTDVGKGDSGGPLVCMKTGDPNEQSKGILVGVVSGHRTGVGSFFTRVSNYYKYIERNKSCTNDKSYFIYLYLAILIQHRFLLFSFSFIVYSLPL
ncbi:unnamed protein product [Parnassius mnemosyne]|uniref:Peptidase S1 domain-containing protein n=1 Tax=Parnassius mnemosyne TaxID=213953 RepID=A0AAV1KTT5_9NEOP